MYVFSNRETRGLPVPEFSYFVLISCENQLITVECDVYTVPVQNDHRSPVLTAGGAGTQTRRGLAPAALLGIPMLPPFGPCVNVKFVRDLAA